MPPVNIDDHVVTDHAKHTETTPAATDPTPRVHDDVIRIEDLAPRTDVSGGRKILLGEYLTPISNPRIPPGS